MKILAVDDDPLILELLVETLRVNGYGAVSTAGCADEAVRMISAAEQPFDCFLLDVVMPEVDGIELCRWIRKSSLYRAVPILMITSMSEKRFIDRAFRAGASDYVTKPFEPVELVTRVRLAQRGLDAERRVSDSGAEIKALKAQIDDQYRAPLSEPVPLDNVDGLIDYLALENYLLQLSRGSFYATSVIALRIQDIGNIYNRCSAAAFRDLLCDVAESALSALKGSDCILSYAGSGTFGGVLGFAETRDLDEVELMINLLIDRLELTDDAGRPMAVRVAVGAPRPVGMLKSGRVAVAQLRRAVGEISWNARPRSDAPAQRVSGARVLLKALAQAF